MNWLRRSNGKGCGWSVWSCRGFVAVAAVMMGVIHSPQLQAQLPVIYEQPKSVAVGEGLPVEFRAVTSGFLGKRFQWFRNGAMLEGEIYEYLYITNATAAEVGTYQLTITNNPFEAVVSDPADLTVVPRVQLEQVGTITPPPATNPGFPMWVKVVDDRAYVASKALYIYDVADPESPNLLGVYGNSQSRIYSVDVEGTRAAVTAGGNLDIVDVSNPAQPVRLGRASLGKSGTDVILTGNLVYVTALGTFRIYDISTLPQMQLVGEYSGPHSFTLTLSEDEEVAYLATPPSSVLVVDVSDPSAPELVQTLFVGQGADSVKVQGRFLYAAGQQLKIFDISDPRQPEELSEGRRLANLGGGANGMNVSGSFVFTDRNKVLPMDPSGFMAVYDAGDPERPIEVARYEYGGSYNGEGIDVEGDLIYLAVGPSVQIFRMLPAANAPVVVEEMGSPLVVEGTTAVLAAHASGGEELGYQWVRDGVELEGETNRVLRISAVTAEDAGDYVVRIWNSAGEVTSAGTVSVVEPGELEFSVELVQSTPNVTFALPEGLQARVQGSFDLETWTDVWSGQVEAGGVKLRDSAAMNVGQRFYRLVYGVE